MKNLLKLGDLTEQEITAILNTADQLKFELKNGIEHHYCKNKTLAMIFAKASTRTRVSFETGIFQLGGQGLFLSTHDLQIGRGEPIQDTARVLSRMVDCIMIRTFAQEDVENLAKYGDIPIINGLTDYCHPCQVLADLMTIREYKGSLKGLKMTFVGDGNNMANSLIVGGIKTGMSVTIACPNDYKPDADIIKWGTDLGKLTITDNVLEACKDADVLYTDVWASMGQESEKAIREKAFKGFQINADVMAVAKPDAMVLHCLPAHREEEITNDVFEAHAAEIFDEAENRLHAQKAVMVHLMAPDKVKA